MLFRVVRLDFWSVFVDTVAKIGARLGAGTNFDLLTERQCPFIFRASEDLSDVPFRLFIEIQATDEAKMDLSLPKRITWTRFAPVTLDDPEPFLGCTHPDVHVDGTLVELRLIIEPIDLTSVDNRGVRLAPPLVPLPRAAPVARPLSVSLRVADSSQESVASSSNAHNEVVPLRYLVMPGNYTGDSWHIAAALVVDADTRVAVPTKSEGPFAVKTAQFVDFCRSVGIDLQRVRRETNLDDLQMVAEAQAATKAKAIIEAHLHTLERDEENPVCGWTFASTSLLLRYAEREGVGALLTTLRQTFPTEPGRGVGYHALIEAIADAGPCVLVNMRRGVRGNHPQHNITRAIFDQIQAAARRHGFAVVRIGGYQDETYTPGGSWMRDNLREADHGKLVEIFTPGQPDNRRHTAWFWSQVADLPNVRGVIGGRSGSLDVAAFMGVRAFCWDLVDVDDHEYARLFLAFPLMSIGRRGAVNDHATDPSGALAAIDLDLWLSDHHVMPDHGGRLARFPRTILSVCGTLSQMTGAGSPERRHRVLMDRLAYLDPFTQPLPQASGASAPAPSGSAMDDRKDGAPPVRDKTSDRKTGDGV